MGQIAAVAENLIGSLLALNNCQCTWRNQVAGSNLSFYLSHFNLTARASLPTATYAPKIGATGNCVLPLGFPPAD